jgi:hypothetical protein
MFDTNKYEENLLLYNLRGNFDDSISILSEKIDNLIDNEKIKDKSKKIFYIYQIKRNPKRIRTKGNKFKINFNNKNLSSEELKGSESNNDNKCNKKFINKLIPYMSSDIHYRKDAYYKHFKVNLGKYIKKRMNILKNKCFPYYSRNNFSTPNYKYTGNPKEKDNLNFLSFTIKEILIYGQDKARFNRQYNNGQLIIFIEENEEKAYDKVAYKELIEFLNEKLEDCIIQYYDDEKEFNRIKSDTKYINFDKFYKRETGISLLEKYGFLTAIKNTKKYIK